MVYLDRILHTYYTFQHCLDTGMQNDDQASPSISPAGRGQLVKMLINSSTTWYFFFLSSFIQWYILTLKAPITTAVDDKFCDIFPIFNKNKVWYYMRIVCQQTILMKDHA